MIRGGSSLERAAFALSFGAAAATLVSIAISHILLAAALAVLLTSGVSLRLPPLKLPLAFFVAWTLLSLALSPDPAAGRPQIRKFFVFLILLAVSSTFRRLEQARLLVLVWIGAATLSSLWSFVQFAKKIHGAQAAGIDFYSFYTPRRITGFMSHWMTLGGEQVVVLLLLAAFLFFSPERRKWLLPGIACGLVIGASLVLGFTRTMIYAAAPAGALWLLWFWKRRWLVAVPLVLALLVAFGGASVRGRFTSIFQPHGEVDSNSHRVVCWRTGVEMIRKHPWFGLGPEMVGRKFQDYVPIDIPRPLPQGWYGHLHNIYLQYAAERGIPALLAMLWLIVKALRDFLLALRRLPPGPGQEKFVLHGAAASVIAVMVAGLFEFNLGDSEVLMLFLTVIACGYLAAQAAAPHPQAGNVLKVP